MGWSVTSRRVNAMARPMRRGRASYSGPLSPVRLFRVAQCNGCPLFHTRPIDTTRNFPSVRNLRLDPGHLSTSFTVCQHHICICRTIRARSCIFELAIDNSDLRTVRLLGCSSPSAGGILSLNGALDNCRNDVSYVTLDDSIQLPTSATGYSVQCLNHERQDERRRFSLL